jgi:hypothetical protein
MPRRSRPARIRGSALVTSSHSAYSANVTGAYAPGTDRQDNTEPAVRDTTAS